MFNLLLLSNVLTICSVRWALFTMKCHICVVYLTAQCKFYTRFVTLRKLENEDIIFLEAANAKNKRVFLTQKGKQLSSETAGKIIDAENRILADWGPETSEQYLALNERYLKCLQKELQRMKAEK